MVVVATRLPTSPSGPGGRADPAESIDLPAGPWHDLLSGADQLDGPTQADQLLAILPHALLVRA
jgi:hypothetical protein